MLSALELWKKVISVLERDITPITITTWFEDSSAVDISGDCLYIYTPNEFKKDIINSRFYSIIKNALFEIIGKDFEFKLLCGEKELHDYKRKNNQNDIFFSIRL